MLKGEIVDAVVELMQDRSATARALAGRWVNVVLDDIASRGHLESLQREERTALVAGDDVSMTTGRDYDLAPNTDKVLRVFVPAWGMDGILRKKQPNDFLRQMLSDGATRQGLPLYYTVFGGRTLRLHPIPSLTYAPEDPTDLQKLHIWKYKDIEHLTEEEEITELTNKATPMLMMGAYRFGARFDTFDDYQSTRQEYEKAIVDFFFQQENDLDRPWQVAYNDY